MQCAARRGHVIDIAGLARHMQAGRIMGQGLGYAHSVTSRTETQPP